MDIYLENFGERQSRASTLAGKIVSVARWSQVITGVGDELILLFDKIDTVGSCKYDYFLGCCVFFSVVHFHLGLFSVSTFKMFISPVNV